MSFELLAFLTPKKQEYCLCFSFCGKTRLIGYEVFLNVMLLFLVQRNKGYFSSNSLMEKQS